MATENFLATPGSSALHDDIERSEVPVYIYTISEKAIMYIVYGAATEYSLPNTIYDF